MNILNFKTKLKGRLMEVVFPKKKTIILRGNNATDIIYRIESLLSNDYTAYYINADKMYGFSYENFDGESILNFSTGSIFGKAKVVSTRGQVPKMHCIRYLGKGVFRSFVNVEHRGVKILNYDMTKYDGEISDVIWYRIIETTNALVGSKIVDLKDNKLEFNFVENSDLSVEAQKFIYMIISECYLTPLGYSRILLFSDIYIMPASWEAKLLETLDNIAGHSVCLSNAEVEYNHFTSPAVTFLNV